MNLSAGQLFAGDYKLLRPLGEGGMGVVWLARERSLEREVALKIMRPSESATRLLRFAREARALAALDHPSILPVLHTGTDETSGLPYLVTRAVLLAPAEIHRLCHDIFHCPHPRGLGGANPLGEAIGGSGDLPRPLSLADLLEGGKQLPEAAVLRIARDLADALSAAHTAGILHRDLKPSNILFDASGRAILSDFGLAKFLPSSEGSGVSPVGRGGSGDPPRSLSLDEAGQRKFLGSPAYAAPEQFHDGAPLTSAIDWYAFGAILHEALAGERPRALRPLSSYAPDYLSRAWDPLLRGLLDPDPARRLQDPAAIRRALDRIARHPARRRRRRIVAAVGFAALAVAVFVTALRQPPSVPASPKPPETRQHPILSTFHSSENYQDFRQFWEFGKSLDQLDIPPPEPAFPMPLRLDSLWQGDFRGPLQRLNTVRVPVVDDLVAESFADLDPEIRRLVEEGTAAWTATPRDHVAAGKAWRDALTQLEAAIRRALFAAAASGNPADAPSPGLRVQFAIVAARSAWTKFAVHSDVPDFVYDDALQLIAPLVEADAPRYAPLRSWLLAERAYMEGMSGRFGTSASNLVESLALWDVNTMRSWPGCAMQEAYLLASLGEMRRASGHAQEGSKDTGRAILLTEKLAGDHPDGPLANFLAGCYYRMGETQREFHNRQHAAESYETALTLWRGLGNGYALTCAQALGRIAGRYCEMGLWERSLECLTEARDIVRPYAERDPKQYGAQYVIILRNRVNALREIGDIAGAEADKAVADEFESRL